MEGRNFEEIFQKYDFWEKLTQEQKQFLKERVKWNQYQEGQFVTGTGSDFLGMFWCSVEPCVSICFQRKEKKRRYFEFMRENCV
ncbi:MAG: hypothetical protein ACLTA7_03155 [Ruminococcus sp.]